MNSGHGPADEHSARVWDSQTGELRFQLDHPEGVKASYVSGAKQIVTVCQEQVRWWDAETGDQLASLPCPGASASSSCKGPMAKRWMSRTRLQKRPNIRLIWW